MTKPPQELELRMADGVARVWAHRPVAGGERAAVLLYVDAFGVRPTLHRIAERLAALGHVVLLPDVFYRTPDRAPFDLATIASDPAERQRLRALIATLTAERITADARVYLDVLAAQPGVPRGRVAAVGYCMGGRLAFLSAAQHPDVVRAAAGFHAGGLVTDGPDSPHLLAPRIAGPLYLGVADEDASCTPAHQGALAAALGGAHVDYRLELYRGKRHGFAVPDHAAYDRDAGERHWRRLEAFLAEALA